MLRRVGCSHDYLFQVAGFLVSRAPVIKVPLLRSHTSFQIHVHDGSTNMGEDSCIQNSAVGSICKLWLVRAVFKNKDYVFLAGRI